MRLRPRTLSVSEEMRLFAGLLVQPVLAGAVAFFAFPVLLLDQNGRSLAGGVVEITSAARAVAIGSGLMAVLVTLVGALPTAVWLTKRRHVSFREARLWGFGFGNVPMVVGTVLAGPYGVAGFVRGAAFASLLGVTGAAVFWAISLRRQPFEAVSPRRA
jgi:hypothetical protein